MEISVQTGGIIETYGPEKTAKYISQAGFTAIDWNINRGWDRSLIQSGKGLPQGCIYDKSLDEIIAYWKEQLDAYRKYGLHPGQAHAPFPAYAFYDPTFLDYAIQVYENCIRYCDHVGCPQLVLHGICLPYNETRLTHDEVEQLNLKLYSSLIPVLKETNVTICLENLFTGSKGECRVGHCSDPYEAIRHIDALNEMAGKECFGLCLDTGHLHMLHIDVRKYIPLLGKRIKALHIHDNDSTTDQHMAPYTGSFPWTDFLAALKEIGYDGNLNFETFAQVRVDRIPEALVPEFLRHIYAIGEYFRSELQK